MKIKFGHFLNLILFFSVTVFAQDAFQPSDQQLEMFKRLPKAQQQALIKKYGLDPTAMSSAVGEVSEPAQSEPFVLPRSNSQTDNSQADSSAPENGEWENNELMNKQQSIRAFGYDLFAGQPTTFSPLAKAPVPGNYLLGLGDKIAVNLYGKENLQYELEVNRQGQIVVPGLAPIAVAGLTYAEAKMFVKDTIEQQNIGVSAHVAFGELGAIQVFVLGDAHTPGAYTVSSLATVTHAIFASGGIRDIGSLRNIQLKRGGKLVTTLDLYDLLLKGDTDGDAILRSGDVVFIPAVGKQVTVKGAVRRPAIYEVLAHETYGDLLQMAGGATADAYLDKVAAYQYQQGSRSLVNLNFANAAALRSNLGRVSEVVIPRAGERLQGAIQVVGEVNHPGYYQWFDGVTLGSLMNTETGFLTEHSDHNFGLILRKESTGIKALQFSPIEVISSVGEDIALLPNDKLYIFSTVTKNQALLSFEEMSEQEPNSTVIRTKAEKDIEEKFFWDMYAGMENSAPVNGRVGQGVSDRKQGLPTLFELESKNFSDLLKSYTIYLWDPNSRHYLLWSAYKLVLDSNKIGEPLPLVEVTGNVRYPGTYPLSSGNNLGSALAAAGGITNLASPIIKVSRDTAEGLRQFDVHADVVDSFVIAGEDKISVFTNPEANDITQVQIRGEVKFAGTYTVKRGDSLSSLIAKAGGLTDYASAEGAIFTRASLKVKERESLINLTEEFRKQVAAKQLKSDTTEASSLQYSELQRVLNDLTNTQAVGRMVIDLPSLLAGNEEADVELLRGDLLFIPQRSQTVSVVGEVYLPTSHRYQKELTLEDYLSSSGGVKQLGDAANVYVIQANGAVIRPQPDFWYTASDVGLRPGDTIVVPLDANPIENLALWTSVTQIIYQTGVAVAAIGSL